MRHAFVTHELLITIGVLAFCIAVSLPVLRAMTRVGLSELQAVLIFAAAWAAGIWVGLWLRRP